MARTQPFDEASDRYDAWFDHHQEIYRAEVNVLRLLMPASPAEIIEVGVGSGKFAGPLGITCGIEPSEKMALKAERLGIDVVRGVAESLPLAGASWNGVLLVTTICFVDDIHQTFTEAWRVIKPGGCIIIGFVDRESELGRRYYADRARSVFYKDATFYSAREVETYLETAGFSRLVFKQCLLPGKNPGIITDGYGEGSFVAVKGIKMKSAPKR